MNAPVNHIEVNADRLAREAFGLAGEASPGIDGAAVEAMLARMVGAHCRLDAYDLVRRLHGVHGALAGDDWLTWLAVECWNTAKCDRAARRWCIEKAGFDWTAVTDRFVGVGRVLTDRRGNWQLAHASDGVRDGRAVVTIPLFTWRSGMVGERRRDQCRAECLEIVAVDPTDPARRWRICGTGGVLWRGEVMGRIDWPDRIRLFATAFGWLGAGCPAGGYCVVDWGDADARELLHLLDRGLVEAVCDDAAHKKRLARRVRPSKPKLKLRLIEGGLAASEEVA